MAAAFQCNRTDTGAEFLLVDRGLFSRKVVQRAEWDRAPPALSPAVRFLRRLEGEGRARPSGEGLMLGTEALAEVPSSLATSLALPPLAKLSLTLQFKSRVDTPEGEIRVSWSDTSSRRVMPTVRGVFVETGGEVGRLSSPVVRLLGAVAAYNETIGQRGEERIGAWLGVQSALRHATGEEVKTDGFLGSLTIYQAGAFALDVRETLNGPQFDPILMAPEMAGSGADEADAPEAGEDGTLLDASAGGRRDNDRDALLPPDLQKVFARHAVDQGGRTHDAYVLGRNTFVVLEPDLKAALDVVKRVRAAPAAERRAFLRNPRSVLAEALGTDDVEAAGRLFVETGQYSDRVEGLGLWEKPQMPWLTKRRSDWLPETFVLQIGSQSLQMTPERFQDLENRAEAARAEHRSHLEFDGVEHALPDVEYALSSVPREAPVLEEEAAPPLEDVPAEAPPDRAVLLIKTNIDGNDYVLSRPRRQSPLPSALPADLIGGTVAKPHQEDGFAWLVEAWRAGWPGVLLADDMGLGKTFQALAFMAWLRKTSRLRKPSGPTLIVAPTALLKNWQAEAERHLAPGALGDFREAFGPGLARLKAPRGPDWTPDDALDVAQLREAGWILTTYETLATYHRAFARVAYDLVVFDEMQKVKSPDTINTHAAKALNADFVLGLTGTPIENRLEDLWCILDRIAPGYLGGLKEFSRTYGEEDPEALRGLKQRLDEPQDHAPPIMKRRMKEDILEGLPPKSVRTYRVEMPAPQASAYHAAVVGAKAGEQSMGAMLKAIHALRGISLHPDGAASDPYDPAWQRRWVENSARVRQTIAILQDIEANGEKALVFIEDRAVQKAFAAVAASVFRLPGEPSIINGAVAGGARQSVVDRFQASKGGFDLLLLSPKAAGVGLTITAANHVIHLSRWWNPAVEDQCNDRVYRIGQDKPVFVHVPLAIHPGYGDDSFDVKLDRLLTAKRSLSRHMLAPPTGDGDISRLFTETVASVGPY
jgi:hypothetical protein